MAADKERASLEKGAVAGKLGNVPWAGSPLLQLREAAGACGDSLGLEEWAEGRCAP